MPSRWRELSSLWNDPTFDWSILRIKYLDPNSLYMKPLFVAACLLVLSACSTTNVSVDSVPSKAMVFMRPLGSSTLVQVGETPLQTNGEVLRTQMGSGGPVAIEIRRNGFKSAYVYLTESGAMDVDVKIELQSENGLENLDRLDAVIDGLFEAQRLARAGQYDESLKRLEQLEQAFPTIGAVYELKGGVYYLKKMIPESLNAYYMAIKYNPKNTESLKMRNALETKLGVRMGNGGSEADKAPEINEKDLLRVPATAPVASPTPEDAKP